MKNIALVLSYDGTNFNGWQIQKNGPSIQESMEDAIFHLLKQKVHVSGALPEKPLRSGPHTVPRAPASPTILPAHPRPLSRSFFHPADASGRIASRLPEPLSARCPRSAPHTANPRSPGSRTLHPGPMSCTSPDPRTAPATLWACGQRSARWQAAAVHCPEETPALPALQGQ